MARITGAKGPSLSRAAQSDNAALTLEENLNNQYRTENFNNFVNFCDCNIAKYFSDNKNLIGAGAIVTELGDKFMLIKWERFKG